MATSIADMAKHVRARRDALVKLKKDFKGDGKIDVVNTSMTLATEMDKTAAAALAIKSARDKLAAAQQAITDQQKEITTQIAAYNTALNAAQTAGNTIKGRINKNDLTDKAKDTKAQDFGNLESDIEDIIKLRPVPTK